MKLIKGLIASDADLRLATPKRSLYSSKLDNGRVMVVGGSEDYHGAPALASNAAYSVLAAIRVGAGYAVAFVPKNIVKETRCVSPNIIVRQLSGKNLDHKDLKLLYKSIERFDSLVIGPGLGRKEESLKAISKLISYAIKKEKRTVVDADALYAVAKYNKKLNKNFIITPNEKEFSLFYKGKINRKNLYARVKASINVSKSINAVVLLKGHNTIITDSRRVKVVESKSSALSTMGSGDVLSGIIGAYSSNNKDLFIASVAGAYLHSQIGDILSKEKGNHILASDVVDNIPKILKKFDKTY